MMNSSVHTMSQTGERESLRGHLQLIDLHFLSSLHLEKLPSSHQFRQNHSIIIEFSWQMLNPLRS